MKLHSPQHALVRVQRGLQSKAYSNYCTFLRLCCRNHLVPESVSTVVEGLLVDGITNKSSVERLMAEADALVSQKYDTAQLHFGAHQLAALIRKYPFPEEVNPFTPETEAVATLRKAEASCFELNKKFAAHSAGVLTDLRESESDLHRMRSFISYVISSDAPFRDTYDESGFGPGAAIGVHGNATHIGAKLNSVWSVSPGAYHYAFFTVMQHAQLREMIFPNVGGFTDCRLDWDPFQGPFRDRIDVVQHNKIAFVPKTARTHRAIAVEPLLNGFLQKGVDQFLRKRLLRIGIDLTDQESNSQAARQGSLEDSSEDPFCTIDLSSASDSISIGLVKNVLPPVWFEYLNSIRSVNGKFPDGEVIRYQKFCSMGNGFCFPLETLIFAAVCHAVGCGTPGKDFLVYGDDIIVRRSKFARVVKLLELIGFATNPKKTFSEGPFRESCGGDWFGGLDVRPYTLDFALDSVQSVFKALNGTLRNSLTAAFFEGTRSWLIERIPRSFRFFRPYPGPVETAIDSTGDEHLSCPHCIYLYSKQRRIRCWSWKELTTAPVSDNMSGFPDVRGKATALLYAALTGSASGSPFTLRRKTKTKVRLISHPGATSQWLPPASS